ncbi:uncharacterized protein DUF4229 [Williamsia limnetica]|uniref:Uncharacterized protein DUF4229 n=1 Tax=Williamsia limnetica TaxID=882452 RepID=A0A318S0W5_WILLI|nr:uncharacterized protein DUF4229 [Williamsia limnetica]
MGVSGEEVGPPEGQIPAGQKPAGEKPSSKKRAAAAPVTPSPGAGKRLAMDLALFTGARIALVIALAAGIYLLGNAVGIDVPVLVAAFFAVIIALPLGMVLFKGLRDRVNVGIATVDAGRKAQRENLTSRLRGQENSTAQRDGKSKGSGKS